MAITRKPLSPYKGDQDYIFVSYSHKNTDAILKLIARLQGDGYRVWYDEGIDPGTEWDENIATHVESCGCFIAFLSREYLASSNCKDELNFARELEKPRLLVYLEDIELPGGMRMRLGRLQAVHMYRYTDEQDFFEKLYGFSPLGKCRQLPGTAEPPSLDFAPFSKSDEWDTLRIGSRVFSGHLVGKGYAGKVYRFHDEAQNRDFVFKKYPTAVASSIPLFCNYDLERDLRQLKQENICRVLDIILGPEPAIVMEYIDGKNLRYYMEQKLLSLSESIDIVKQVLLGLEALHDMGIYYGDLTPYNVMLSNQRAYLCDFSEANYNGERCNNLTLLPPEVDYHSPEQRRMDPIDFRSDIYEAGMLLDSLTGLGLRSGERFTALNEASSTAQLLVKIIQKATEKEVEQRYQSTSEMLQDVDLAYLYASTDEMIDAYLAPEM